jgi:hypothetical protein
MPSWLECDNEHLGKALRRSAAIALSRGHALRCLRCGKPFRYYWEFTFANVKGEKNCYEVIRTARLYTHRRKDGFDPFLFLLRHCDDPKNVKVLPVFWAPGKRGNTRWGQFPPLLSMQDWKKLLRKLKN